MSLLGSIGKGLAGIAKGAVSMIPVAGPALAGLIPQGGRPAGPAMPAISNPFVGVQAGAALGPFSGGVSIGKTTTYGGNVNFSGTGNGAGCPKGYHLNKHALPASKRHGAVPARSLCVRNRHLNALNGRAAGRALRRLKRADKMTRKIHRLFHRPAARKGAFGRKK